LVFGNYSDRMVFRVKDRQDFELNFFGLPDVRSIVNRRPVGGVCATLFQGENRE